MNVSAARAGQASSNLVAPLLAWIRTGASRPTTQPTRLTAPLPALARQMLGCAVAVTHRLIYRLAKEHLPTFTV